MTAITAVVDKKLLHCFKSVDIEAEALRLEIQGVVKLLRLQGVHAKDYLHLSLYKWAYAKLTGR